MIFDSLVETVDKVAIQNQKDIKALFGSRSSGSKWPGGLSTYQEGLTLDHYTLRQNSRDAYHDSSAARGIIERISDSVAGTGLVLEPVPKNDILGISLEEAEKWGEDVAQRFDCFAKSKLQNRSETMNLYQACRFSEICTQRDGEIFIRLHYSPDQNLINPLQFEFIDPNQIRGDAYTSTAGPYSQDDGIIRDERGREKAYKIWVQNDKTFEYKEIRIQRKGPKSKRIFMLHRFAPEYPGQHRGYSRLSHALQEFENITDFTSAQIKKAISQSNISFYTSPSDDAPASNPFEGIISGSGGAGPTSGITAAPLTETEKAVYNPGLLYTPLPEATITQPGNVGLFSLEKGEDFKPFQNTAPSDGFGSFVNDFTAYLSASFSMPLEILLMKFNENYSASRAALLLFWNVATIWRQEQATDIMDPIYEMWLSEEIARGTIKAPGWSNPILKAAWLNSRWIGPSMPNIDPMKTMKADQGYVAMGATTQDRVARELNGSDAKTNIAKNERVFNLMKTPVPWESNQGANNG